MNVPPMWGEDQRPSVPLEAVCPSYSHNYHLGLHLTSYRAAVRAGMHTTNVQACMLANSSRCAAGRHTSPLLFAP